MWDCFSIAVEAILSWHFHSQIYTVYYVRMWENQVDLCIILNSFVSWIFFSSLFSIGVACVLILNYSFYRHVWTKNGENDFNHVKEIKTIFCRNFWIQLCNTTRIWFSILDSFINQMILWTLQANRKRWTKFNQTGEGS